MSTRGTALARELPGRDREPGARVDRGPGSAVVALQRVAGNRALAALLAREKGSEAGGDMWRRAEHTFGTDLSDTDVVTGSQEARALGVRAFTRARSVHFADSAAALEGDEGRRLLGHELAHVVQQRQGRVAGRVRARGVSVDPSVALEAEADRAGTRFAAGERADARLRDPAPSAPGADVVQMNKGWLWALVQRNPWLTTAVSASVAALVVAYAYTHLGDRTEPRWLLNELPESLWWRLYIDKQHQDHRRGARYDTEESKGYEAGMLAAFKQELTGGPKKRLDAEGYRRLHDLVTSSLEDSTQDFRGLSTRDYTVDAAIPSPPTQFGIGGKGTLAADIVNETLLGVPLVLDMNQRDDIRGPDDPPRICDFSGTTLYVCYTARDALRYAQAALTRYYREIGAARRAPNSKDEKLRAIVRAIRALHVIHAFKDANGRLNIYVLLNRFLGEEGFPPVILPHGPDVFGGSYTIDELVTEVKEGMAEFSVLLESSAGGL